jgi:hypothetical protein
MSYRIEDLRHYDYDHEYRRGIGCEKLANLSDERTLVQINELSQQGWELTAVSVGIGFFKRRIESNTNKSDV